MPSVTIPKTRLLEALSLVAPALAAGAKSGADAFRVHSANGSIRVAACNFALFLETSVAASTAGDIRCCIPAKLLTPIIRELDDGDLTISAGPGRLSALVLKAGRSTFRITAVTPYEALPSPVAVLAATPGWELLGESFGSGLSSVMHSMSDDENRPTMRGVQIAFNKDRIVFTATDGRRLAQRTVSLTTPSEATQSVVLARPAVLALARIMRSAQGTLQLNVCGNLTTGEFTPEAPEGIPSLIFQATNTEGLFPPIDKVLGAALMTPAKFSVPSIVLGETAKRVSLACDGEVPSITMAWSESGLDFSGSGKGNETAAADTLVAEVTGPKGRVGVNPRFLCEAIAGVPSSNVAVTVGSTACPVRLDSEGYAALVMPMRQD